MKRRIWAAGFAAAFCGVMLALPTAAMGAVVPTGLSVGGQDLGGLEAEDAEKKIEEYVAGMSGQTISLEVEGTTVETTAEDLGFTWENTDVVEESVREYHTGNVIRRYMKQKDLARNPVNIELEVKVDQEAAGRFVEEQCAPFAREAQDATVIRENGQFVVTPSQTGIAIDLDGTKEAFYGALAAGLEAPVHVKASVTVTEPARTTEMLSQIQDMLGTFSTDFSSSGAARSTNLKVGASKINGHVLMPGETLSGYECMQPFTRANGYAAAAAYENGQVVDSIGGGVCQIATTLYNAALNAELEITQRQNHSMIVTYVPPSNDAAIAGTYKDIKVTNPYDTPIYVEGGTSGRTLTFTIYGKETRPANRTVKYKSETLSVRDPGEPITQVDPSLAPGARIRVQSAHRGLKSRLWKCVYIDGVETERILLHTDTYNASKAIYKVGPEAPPPQQTEPAPPQNTGGEQQTAPAAPVEGIGGGPGVTGPSQPSEPASTPGPGTTGPGESGPGV
ncbi:MAG: vanomycin resistance protein VanB [Hungatella sp.]|nr:vanomycin resistance protein VanB [Hungatella sp.]